MLQIAETTNNAWYICPVLIGRSTSSGFSDFSLNLYPNSLTKVKYACRYNANCFHGKGWNYDGYWMCCRKSKHDESPGCHTRPVTSSELEDLSNGIVRRHTGQFTKPLIFSPAKWNCCNETDKFALPCSKLVLTGDQYKQFFENEWLQLGNCSYGFDKDYE